MLIAIFQEHGALKTFITWGSFGCDYDYACSRYIFREASVDHMLPPALEYVGKPLAWWWLLRINLGFTSSTLSLRQL